MRLTGRINGNQANNGPCSTEVTTKLKQLQDATLDNAAFDRLIAALKGDKTVHVNEMRSLAAAPPASA